MNYLISKDYSPETPYYFYKTTNPFNGKFYYGSGSDIKPSYKGSGTTLSKAFRKYGKKNFKHERLRYFKTREDAYEFEERFLTLFNLRQKANSYNRRNKGLGFDMNNTYSKNRVTIIDENGNSKSITKDQFDSTKHKGITKGMGTYILDGQNVQLSIDDTLVISGKAIPVNKNMGLYKKSDGTIVRLSIDDYDVVNGNVIGINNGSIPWNRVIDINGKQQIVKDWASDFGIRPSMLFDYMDTNNICYKIIETKKYKPFTSKKLEIDGQIKNVESWVHFWKIPCRKKIILDYLKEHNINYNLI